MAGGGPDDDGSSIDDDEFAKLLDPEFAAAAVIDEPTAEERARIARREDLQRRLAEEEERAARAAEERRRQERRQRGGRADRRPIRIAVAVLLVIALAAAVSYAFLRGPGPGSSAAGPSTTSERPAGYPPAPKDEASKPLGTPPALPAAAGPYEFEITQPSGKDPVAWDPCRPVRYVINPAGAPPGGVDLIKQAVSNTAAATGLEFHYEGTTTESWSKERKDYQAKRYGKRWAPALIAWGTEADVAGLGGYVAGLGGATPEYDPSSNSTRELYVSGAVVLDSADLGAALAEPGGADVVRSIIQHELGHMVGLDHVADPTQLMFTEGSPRQTNDWGAGDLRGLHALGTGKCMPDA